jgi:hypothetical protein
MRRLTSVVLVILLAGCAAERPAGPAVTSPVPIEAANASGTGAGVAQFYRCSVLLAGRNTAGSGFLFAAPPGVFLVTARHVLFNADGGLRDNRLVVGPQIQPGGLPSSPPLTLDLSLLQSIGETRTHPHADAAVVRLARPAKTAGGRPEIIEGVLATGNVPVGLGDGLLSAGDCLAFGEVREGANAMLVGFPISLTAILTTPGAQADIPLLRRGAVAGRYPAGPLIITDIPSLPGNSGGPVAQQADDRGERWKLIGLLSGLIAKQVGVGTNDFEIHTGYSFVVPMDAVLELVRGWH